MAIRLTDLRNFREAASCRTFSEAAKRLGISQPSLSESIKRLESDIGNVLFYRTKAGIQLTPAGRHVEEAAKSVVGLIAEMELPDSRLGASPRSVLIGCHPVVGSYILPTALKKLSSRWKVQIHHGHSRAIQESVQNGIVDIGLVVNPVMNPDLVIRQVGVDRVCVWSAKQGNQDRIICDSDLIQTQTILRRWKKHPGSFLYSNSLELISRLTQTGVGIGIIPSRTVELLNFPLRKVSGTPEFEDEICIVHRPEFGKSDHEQEILENLKTGLN